MVRKQMNIRIDADLRDEFKSLCKEKSLSTCFVVETLLRAWIAGLKAPAQAKVDIAKAIVIHQTFNRTFMRGRRFLGAGKKDQWKDVDISGEVNETNYYDPRYGWSFKADESLNDAGHAVGCLCSVCRIPSV